ncbi:Uracil DNA glycosylase superfamily [Anaerococcus prevotii]|uniref:Uracil-DNA glycosylase superfamily n=1 Tax=Anaerococcus prevotii (strain ATCC 9321 / DSM 20548 / JCM 6508 / NCTC 11806 / PC1) TaxID=525919 RepID=C7RDE3_ANAPD|nr:uracil-DNA glycosylase family protein [Anaerococcus prevotii]ACV29206.1 Uracil-DNA glycosylase superfamily [Anaerococcus prevotii DSM 20548]SUU94881.1 Uracil DNA glycosylase superfamily [Anaerococcus prevotii]
MNISQIKEKLKKDERNKAYSERGIDPIFQVKEDSKILIIGQAPGKRVEETGILFNDKSGERLVDWLGIDMKTLHGGDFSIIPMDFYYPGKGKSGDKAPRRFIAKEYHPYLLENLKNIELTILIGAYSQKFYLKDNFKKNLTETVKSFEDYLPKYFPLVHPSPLNNRWMAKNPFFEKEVLPDLRNLVGEIL